MGDFLLDEELEQTIQRAMDGNKSAFEKLVCRYKNHIVNIALGILGNAQDAEDVAQEAFFKAYVSIQTLKNAHAFYRWLVKITTNLSIDRKKNCGGHEQQVRGLESLIDLKYQPEIIIEQKEKQAVVFKALEEISLEHRTVVWLRELHGFTYEEIAEILDIPLGTVKSRVHTARSVLRRLLGRKAGDHAGM